MAGLASLKQFKTTIDSNYEEPVYKNVLKNRKFKQECLNQV